MNKRIVKANETNAKPFEFGFEVTKEVHSLGQFVNMVKNGAFKWNDPLQREYVWNFKKRSTLIVSAIEGINIGELKAEIIRESGKRKRNIIDGKQRGLTLYHYRNNKWALDKETYVRGIDEEGNIVFIDISGLKFSELPIEMQDRLNSIQIQIECYEDLPEELKAELFFRWNNGEALKAAEKRKAKMSMELIKAIDEIKQSPVFQFGFSESALNRDANGEAVLQSMTVLVTDGDTGLNNKTLDAMIDDNAYTTEIIEEMKQITKYLEEVSQAFEEKQLKEIFKKNKITAMVLAVREAIKQDITPEMFSDWALLIFDKESEERGFKQYLSGSTAKKEIVKKRIEIMMKDFTSHFSLQEPVEIIA